MKYFTIDELTASDTAKQRGIANTPTASERTALTKLIDYVLDPAREALGKPIRVSSGYRSLILNAYVGGAKGSQHTKGQAADLKCSDNARLFFIIKNNLKFTQLIWEFGDHEQPQWVHVGYDEKKLNCEVLRAIKRNGKTIYLKF